MSDILVVIPDYGDKHGVTRKNLRILGDKPLISYSIKVAKKSEFKPDIIVSTNDIEIINICKKMNVAYTERPNQLDGDNVTLDPIVYHALSYQEKIKNKTYDLVITLQATSPLLKVQTLDEAIKSFLGSEYDTYVSAINRPHLAWHEKNGEFYPLFEKRENRKYLPKHLEENGTFVISNRQIVTPESRFGIRVYVFEISKQEGLEILSLDDWMIAESVLNRRNILIRLEGYKEIGMGHIYRGLQLASALFEHNVFFAVSEKSKLAVEKITERGYECHVIKSNKEVPDIIRKCKVNILVNDILDTDKAYIDTIKECDCRVVNLEDLGSGIQSADVVINDLYSKQNDLPNCYWGQKYYCLKDEFLIAEPKEHSDEVKEVLMMFGGTDPCNITEKAICAIAQLAEEFKDIHYTVIMGAGNKNGAQVKKLANAKGLNITFRKDVSVVSEYMSKADVALSSQGRTMFELAHMTVPTVVIAQNKRELTHEFGYLANGFINLGLGENIDVSTIRETLTWLYRSPQIRKQIKMQMSGYQLEKGIHRVKKLILGEK